MRRAFAAAAATAAVCLALSSCATSVSGTAVAAGPLTAATSDAPATSTPPAPTSTPAPPTTDSSSVETSSTPPTSVASLVPIPPIDPTIVESTATNPTDGGATATGQEALPVLASTVTATDDGVITMTNGDAPVTIEIFEDPLCPNCGEFEAAHGQAIMAAVEAGHLAVRYRLVNFLDPASASGDYSSRAFAAMLSIIMDGDPSASMFAVFHATLFDASVQPKENSSTDFTSDEFAEFVGSLGGSTTMQTDISKMLDLALAKQLAGGNLAELQAVADAAGIQAAVPLVTVDGLPVDISSPQWLEVLLGG